MWPTVGTPRMCSDQSFSERPPPSWPPEQCFLATSGSRSDTDWWFKFVSKPSILSFSQPTESALAFGASKPWHTSGLGMESGFAVVAYFLLSPLNSNYGDLIRPLCSVELPAIGAIAGRSVRTHASQWIPLGFSLGIGTTQGPTKATRGPCLQSLNRVVTRCGVWTHAVSGGLERCMIV